MKKCEYCVCSTQMYINDKDNNISEVNVCMQRNSILREKACCEAVERMENDIKNHTH